MRILILGQNGQVGSALKALCQINHIDFMATDRTALNITNKKEVEQFFAINNAFDFMINATAYTAVDKAESEPKLVNEVNNLSVKFLSDQSKKYEIPLLHLSTDYVFDGTKNTSYAESDSTSPLGLYGQTKREGELAVERTLSEYIILRVSWVFGEHGNNFVKTMAKLACSKGCLSVVSDQYGSPTSAKDIARVVIEIIQYNYQNENPIWGVFHYSGFPVTNWHQLAIAAINEAKAQGLPVCVQKINTIESKDYPTVASRPKNSAFNVQKIKNNFNILQSNWQNDIANVITQLKQEME